ncbi:hypothetical protein BURPS1710b_A0346 [Burkholderia pseudomallei 1710b]|uniref:Uncharacterized protein n=2 Tax=Burkholderia pseudomallei TaxID=28450 RepID=Q3JLP8_BURP1|nr:hypothetical protein BURPS1710b_A0346 [Burkholderia pseudomallei 1710b]EET04491.1 conserved hypothetical protein [Burkholderia pseudomallei 1710a]
MNGAVNARGKWGGRRCERLDGGRGRGFSLRRPLDGLNARLLERGNAETRRCESPQARHSPGIPRALPEHAASAAPRAWRHACAVGGAHRAADGAFGARFASAGRHAKAARLKSENSSSTESP